MIWEFGGFTGTPSQSCLVKKAKMMLGYKNLYIHCKKNCLPLYLPWLIFISSTSCSASRPCTITWRWHRIFHGEKNYVQRDEVVNSDASRQGNDFVTIEQVFDTLYALPPAGSDPNLSGAQDGFLHPLILICLNPWGNFSAFIEVTTSSCP